jgi:hypothetical protein
LKSLAIEEVLTAPRSEQSVLEKDAGGIFPLLPPITSTSSLAKQSPVERQIMQHGSIVKIPELGGLHHRYERIAA